MTDSLYLRLAGPIQSWAGPRVTGNFVRSESRPTRSGVEGLLAAAMGWPQDGWEEWIHSTGLTLRVDRPGSRMSDYQTINPRDEDLDYQKRAYLLMFGKRWAARAHFTPDGQNKTSIVRRSYISDAEFLVEVQDNDHFGALVNACRNPYFTTYLGRKAFPTTFPFFLGFGQSGLLESLPTAKQKQPGHRFQNDYFDSIPEPDHGHLRLEKLKSRSSSDWRMIDVEQMPRDEWMNFVASTLSRTKLQVL